MTKRELLGEVQAVVPAAATVRIEEGVPGVVTIVVDGVPGEVIDRFDRAVRDMLAERGAAGVEYRVQINELGTDGCVVLNAQ